MTLLISKKTRAFEFISPEEKEELSLQFTESDKYPQLSREKWEEISEYENLKPELRDELLYYVKKESENKNKNKNKSNNLEDVYYNEKYLQNEYNDQILEKQALLPLLPVWMYSRCYDYDNWMNKYQKYIEDMIILTYNYISHLNMNGYDIKVNEKELFNRLSYHIYRTSENVKTNYIFLK